MTKKHFEAIAHTIAVARARYEARNHDYMLYDPEMDALDALSAKLARYFKTVNPNFDRKRFLNACKTAPKQKGGM
jgi:hypothetical protein